MAQLSTLADDFPGTTVNASRWGTVTFQTGDSASVANNQLTLTATPSGYAYVSTNSDFNLSNSSAALQYIGDTSASNDSYDGSFWVTDTTGGAAAEFGFLFLDGAIQTYYNGGAGQSILTSSLPKTAGMYLRIRADTTNLYTDYSPDGQTWTNLDGITYATANFGGLTSVFLTIENYNDTISGNTTLTVANLNMPIVGLSSPSNGGSVTSTTPQLQFIGNEPNSDTLTYEVEVDTASTFDAQVPLIKSFTTFDTFYSAFGGGGVAHSADQIGRSFSPSSTGKLSQIQGYIHGGGTLTGTLQLDIYAATGSSGSYIGTGAALASSDVVNASTLPTSTSWVSFNFSGTNQITLTSGTEYVYVFNPDNMNASGYVSLATTTSATGDSPQNDMQLGYVPSALWSSLSTSALAYKLYFTGTPLIDALSASGGHDTAQFSDVTHSGDSNPFPSGDTTGFTVPSGEALTNGLTYYWRARAKAPSGTNTWGGWSPVQHFLTGHVYTKSTTGGVSFAGANHRVTHKILRMG